MEDERFLSAGYKNRVESGDTPSNKTDTTIKLTDDEIKSLVRIGELITDKKYELYELGSRYILEASGVYRELGWEERTFYLNNPWDKISYYIDDQLQHHYSSIVYDGIELDIYSKTITGLLNLISRMNRVREKLDGDNS